MMTYEEALEYIHAFTWSRWKLGLDRTRELLGRLGNPQNDLKFIHVAGSNGKGSTCAMIERILREAGLSTGMYPSPYIEDFRERIQYNGEMIPEETLCRLTEVVKKEAEAMEDHPSQFEIITAIGMLYFREMQCDIVVLEVGLGGLHDSTNIIDAPVAAVITNIGLEHTEYLGSTLAEIAANKGGIIKGGSSCVCYENAPEVMDVISSICAEKNVPLRVSSFDSIVPLEKSLHGQTFLYKENGETYSLNLLGEYQLHNVATALTVIEVLREKGFEIPDEAVRKGLAEVTWPARFEVLCYDPVFVLDGGHNPQCAEALAKSLDAYFPGEKVTFLMGMLKDKDRDLVYQTISPYAAEYICLTPNSDRALTAEELADFLTQKGGEAQPAASVEEGILLALHTGRPVIAFGSLYMAGEIKKKYRPACKVWQRRKASANRRQLTPEEKAEKSRRICEALLALPEVRDAKTCFSYMAMSDEADLTYFHEEMKKQGKRLAFPLTHGAGEMSAAIPAEEDGWMIGAYGIETPVEEKAEILKEDEIDLILAPCVAFDREGNRSGHGAGYYDRYLSRCDLKKTKVILIAFEAQRLLKICTESTDIRIPVIVTEGGVIRTEA